MVLVALLVLISTDLGAEPSQRIREQELAEVRARIAALKESLAEAGRRRSRLNRSLEEAEAELATTRRELTAVRRQERDSEARRVAIAAEIGEREQALGAETGLLLQQLRSAYKHGRTERLRLLLDAEDPARLGRRMAYYGYLNDWRKTNIEKVEARLAALELLHDEERAVAERLESLARERNAQLERAEAVRRERGDVLASLNTQIEREGGEVAELGKREQELERLIAELASILSDYPIASGEPFAELRGELTWPVAGSLRHDFGQPRAGSALRWKGVVLAAERGREVRALYHGRVAFSDWLPGLGLLTIIDHGDGYLSLYGHADSLLKDVGEWVAAGDVIATVGDSGGRAEPGLYLEIRRGKEPLNPRRWISRRPRE
ncbi:MAG: peptidoglycan DD-metalloendopeptidase family protein [Pseudomonadota bacterium]